MLRAKDFIELDSAQPALEVARLKDLYARISTQTIGDKQKLAQDLLDVFTNPDERLAYRLQACLVLATKSRDLGLKGSSVAVRSLRGAVEKDFLMKCPQRQSFFQNRKALRKLDPVNFVFLECGMAAILSIDFQSGKRFAEEVLELLQDAQLKMRIEKLVEVWNRNEIAGNQ